jgi:hypothetical protein
MLDIIMYNIPDLSNRETNTFYKNSQKKLLDLLIVRKRCTREHMIIRTIELNN